MDSFVVLFCFLDQVQCHSKHPSTPTSVCFCEMFSRKSISIHHRLGEEGNYRLKKQFHPSPPWFNCKTLEELECEGLLQEHGQHRATVLPESSLLVGLPEPCEGPTLSTKEC